MSLPTTRVSSRHDFFPSVSARKATVRLSKPQDNYERASQAVPVTDREGEPIGEFKYEGSVANRALELIGKELGMFIERTENTTTVKTISPDPLTPEEWSEQHATSH